MQPDRKLEGKVRNLKIIIPVFNQLFYTRQVITSIINVRKTSKEINNCTVWIVDNGSTDGTREFLQSDEYSKLTSEGIGFYYVINSENKGYGGGINAGIAESNKFYGRGDYDFIFMNNDMVLLEGCLDELIKAAYSKEEIGIVGGKLLFPDGTIQHAGAFLNAFGWGQHIGGGQRDDDYLDVLEPKEMEYCTGALLYIKSQVIKEVGLLDERFEKGYFEEVDFSYRAREFGWKTYYTPFAKAIHYENITSKAMEGDQEKVKKMISDKNQIKFYLKREEEQDNPVYIRRGLFKGIQGLRGYEYEDNTEVVPLKEDSPHKLLITSQIYGEWSFTMVMRNLAKGLKRNGVDVSIAPVEYHYDKLHMMDWEIKEMIQKPNDYWNRVVLRSCEGDHMYLMPPGKKRVAHTTGESNRITNGWRDQLNNVDLVLTTSTFFKNVLENNGVKTGIKVLPNSVNLDYFKREGNKLKITGLKSLNFVSVFHFGERKAPEVLVRAFCKAFSSRDDVTLTLHALSMEYILKQKKQSIGDWIREVSEKEVDRTSILVTTSFIEDRLVPDFLRNFDVFVLPTRGEGFGLPFIEAGALGIPSIATNYSGQLDYVNNDNGWLIDYSLKDIPLQYLPYYQNYIGGQWAEPNEDHLVEVFREVYNNRESIKEKGKVAYEKSQSYSVENVGKLAKELIFDV
jgi:hypothetical protein